MRICCCYEHVSSGNQQKGFEFDRIQYLKYRGEKASFIYDNDEESCRTFTGFLINILLSNRDI